MNIIEIENLTYSYPAAKSPILKNISLTVEEGDFLAVVGNNGCGKSTFCKTLNGLIPHFIDGDFEGTVKVGGINTLESDVGTLACKAGYVYQDFENQIVRPTVLDDASYACLNYAMPDYIERGRQALSLCGLEGREDDYIWQLSGGQTHLLALAGAVSLRPDILILDEPTVGLDPKQIIEIRNLIKNLGKRHTIILSSHILPEVQAVCDRVIVINKGKLVADDTAENLSRNLSDDFHYIARIEGPEEEVLKLISTIPGMKDAQSLGQKEEGVFEFSLEAEPGADIRRELFKRLSERSYPLLGLKTTELTLEDIFLQLTQDGGNSIPTDGGAK